MRRTRLREAHKAGVRGIVSCAVSRADGKSLDALLTRSATAHRAPFVFGTHGLHPYAVHADRAANEAELSDLQGRLQGGQNIVAVGECGLDFRRRPDGSARFAPPEEQRHVCERQLELARRLDMPAVLHCVKAHGPLLELLETFEPPPSVLHAYSGSAEHALRLTQRGHYISFAATILLNDAKRAHAAVRAVPVDRILIETDSPDQCPAHLPPPNRPAYVVEVARAVAALRGMSLAEVAEVTFENACRVFGIGLSS